MKKKFLMLVFIIFLNSINVYASEKINYAIGNIWAERDKLGIIDVYEDNGKIIIEGENLLNKEKLIRITELSEEFDFEYYLIDVQLLEEGSFLVQLSLSVKDSALIIDDKAFKLSAEPLVVDGTLMVPIRAFMKTMERWSGLYNYPVRYWGGEDNIAEIISNGSSTLHISIKNNTIEDTVYGEYYIEGDILLIDEVMYLPFSEDNFKYILHNYYYDTDSETLYFEAPTN